MKYPRNSFPDFAERAASSVAATPRQNTRLRSGHCGLAENICSTASIMQDKPNFDVLPGSAFVRISVLVAILGCSKATIWRWVKASKFPSPKKLGPRITVWNVAEIRKVLAACMSGGNHD